VAVHAEEEYDSDGLAAGAIGAEALAVQQDSDCEALHAHDSAEVKETGSDGKLADLQDELPDLDEEKQHDRQAQDVQHDYSAVHSC